jgi:Flp pilus assembly protein CpaB
MRLAVVVLIMLGLLAAGSAAFLINWVQARSAAQAGPQLEEVPVLVAQSDLPARTRLTVDDVVVEQATATGLPESYFSSPPQAIGKTLKLGVVRGQALTPSCFLPENAIDDLLKPGMLAFQIPLARRSTAVDLLYPGCVVDIFATFPLRDRDKGEAVVTPLLQNIQVLGVRDETVVTTAQEQDSKNPVARVERRRITDSSNVTVTLAVTSRQAAALQLTMERGTLGLAMRNPLDKNWNPMEPMVVKEGQLTAASEAMDPQTLALFSRIQQMLSGGPMVDPNKPSTAAAQLAGAGTDPNAGPIPLPAMPTPEYVGTLQQKRVTSKVDVIRGREREEVELEVKNEPNEVEEALLEGGS